MYVQHWSGYSGHKKAVLRKHMNDNNKLHNMMHKTHKHRACTNKIHNHIIASTLEYFRSFWFERDNKRDGEMLRISGIFIQLICLVFCDKIQNLSHSRTGILFYVWPIFQICFRISNIYAEVRKFDALPIDMKSQIHYSHYCSAVSDLCFKFNLTIIKIVLKFVCHLRKFNVLSAC